MKHYKFSDCVSYAIAHNITFTFYYVDNLSHIYCDISDGADGYLTATEAIFTFDHFSHKWRGEMNLNIRYAYKKDYELMRRIESALNYGDAIRACHATWNHGLSLWHGALCLGNEHYLLCEKQHGKGSWYESEGM